MSIDQLNDHDVEALLRGVVPPGREDLEGLAALIDELRTSAQVSEVSPSQELSAYLSEPAAVVPVRTSRSRAWSRGTPRVRRVALRIAGGGVAAQVTFGVVGVAAAAGVAGALGALPAGAQQVFDVAVGKQIAPVPAPVPRGPATKAGDPETGRTGSPHGSMGMISADADLDVTGDLVDQTSPGAAGPGSDATQQVTPAQGGQPGSPQEEVETAGSGSAPVAGAGGATPSHVSGPHEHGSASGGGDPGDDQSAGGQSDDVQSDEGTPGQGDPDDASAEDGEQPPVTDVGDADEASGADTDDAHDLRATRSDRCCPPPTE